MSNRVRLISKQMKQTAVLWTNSNSDGYGGRSTGSPVEVSVLWMDKQEKFVDINGEEILSNAVVYIDRALTKGTMGWGYLYLGTLASLSGETDPMEVREAREIKQYVSVPSFRNTQRVRKCWLV